MPAPDRSAPDRRLRVLLVALAAMVLVTGAAYYGLAVHAPAGPRSLRVFDADRMADLETRMWQAYYRKEKLRLFSLLVTMLHEQCHYPWSRALAAGFRLARAAARFGDLRPAEVAGYDVVLPDLAQGFALARDWTGAGFDPQAVARAELGWWAARRLPDRSSAENVGERIADLYALFYETPRPRVREAALLRAQAAALRDRGGDQADWDRVHALLVRSYRSLRAAF
jgi:hypothetical protein